MDAERFLQLRSLFEAVHDLPPSERIGYLHTQGADAELIAEVLTLLDASASHNTAQFARPLQAALAAEAPQVLAGDQLGVWRIEREIAQGGMGSVYEVKRADGHFAQTAALKFIKGRQGLGAQVAFARERQLLATLAHPHIARLLDGGADAQGYPYLVMELVDGVAIDQYCREHALPTRRVLDLFVSACDAVAFAHRQLIIHCDLKPGNLLVTTDARPMLLDFGIAQLLSGVADADTAPRDAAQPKPRAFTPRYASPEQQRGERLTTTSDIFSLGVMLRELLALQPARDGSEYELDAICTKATHADPLQRYPTVEALCADIDRFRSLQPVQALPATLGYWLRKLLLRRWLAVLVGGGFIVMAMVFTARVTSESQRALAAEKTAVATRDRALKAEAEALASEASAVQVSEFLISVFDGANPDAHTGTVVTSVLVDAALERVANDLTDQPATQSQMYAALGAVLYTIEQPQRGLATYRRAIEIERTQTRPLVLARMLIDSAMWRLRHFDGADAIPDAREGLQLVERHSAPDAVLLLDALHTVARLISGSGDAAEGSALLARALPLARRIAPDSERLNEVLGTVAWHERGLGNHDRAIALMQEQIALDARLNGADRVEHANLLSALAGTLGLANRYSESEAVFKRAIAQRRAHNAIDNRLGA